MTDEQITSALEGCGICGDHHCDEQCPCFRNGINVTSMCRRNLIIEAHDLIKRQQAEIEQWKEEANRYQNLWCDAEKDISNAIIEAQKDFAEKLKKYKYVSSDWSHGEHPYVVEEDDIDNLLWVLTEGSNGE